MFDRDPSPAPAQVPMGITRDSQIFNSQMIPYTVTEVGNIQSSWGQPVDSAPQIPEETLLEAVVASIDTTSLTPLIKEELKYTIQFRRQAQGKQQLKVRFDIPEKSELSEEEKLKLEKRRKQNREAAQRFKDKQKGIGSRLVKKIQDLESRNTLLTTEVKILRAEKDSLKERMREHIRVCPYTRLDT